jgi:hypothetical protein
MYGVYNFDISMYIHLQSSTQLFNFHIHIVTYLKKNNDKKESTDPPP